MSSPRAFLEQQGLLSQFEKQYGPVASARSDTGAPPLPARKPRAPRKSPPKARPVLESVATLPAEWTRFGDRLWLAMQLAPRTMKNSARGVGKRSLAYLGMKDAVAAAILPIAKAAKLPLPIAAYRIEGRFYVDRAGERADIDGLITALFDCLQHAGVVTDDHQFRALGDWEIMTAIAEVCPHFSGPGILCTIEPR